MKRSLLLVFALVGAGCGGDSVSGPAMLSPATDEYLFDTVRGAPSTHQFTFTNIGGDATGPLVVALSGDQDAFQIVADGCDGRELERGNDCAVTVQLDSAIAGNYKGQLHLDAGLTHVFVDLSGSVAPAQLSVAGQLGAVSVVAGGAAHATFALRNLGGASTPEPLTIVAPAGAIISDQCSGKTLAGGASCAVTVQLTAALSDSGDKVVDVQVSDGEAQPLDVQQHFTVTLNDPLTIENGDFGNEDPTAPNRVYITIVNSSGVPVTGFSATIAGGSEDVASDSPFHVVNPSSCEGVLPQQACGVEVDISALLASPGSYTATLTVSALGIAPATHPLQLKTSPSHVTAVVTVSDGGFVITPWSICSSAADVCGASNPLYLAVGAPVSFQATAPGGVTFAGWSGACAGQGATCTLTPAAGLDLTIGATFE